MSESGVALSLPRKRRRKLLSMRWKREGGLTRTDTKADRIIREARLSIPYKYDIWEDSNSVEAYKPYQRQERPVTLLRTRSRREKPFHTLPEPNPQPLAPHNPRHPNHISVLQVPPLRTILQSYQGLPALYRFQKTPPRLLAHAAHRARRHNVPRPQRSPCARRVSYNMPGGLVYQLHLGGPDYGGLSAEEDFNLHADGVRGVV